jgi:DNA modification methylase
MPTPKPGACLDEDSAPEVSPAAVSRPGDLWRQGDHLLLCGDALEAASYSRLLADSPSAMVFTDPPYNVAYISR